MVVGFHIRSTKRSIMCFVSQINHRLSDFLCALCILIHDAHIADV